MQNILIDWVTALTHAEEICVAFGLECYIGMPHGELDPE